MAHTDSALRAAVKVPFVRQTASTDCGAACLCMICAYYGKYVSLEQVRDDCGVSRDGTSVKGLLDAAALYGLRVRAFRYHAESMRTKAEFPCLVILNGAHFVVLTGFRGKNALVNDPARGCYSMSQARFADSFTGICVQFTTAPEFQPDSDIRKRNKHMANLFPKKDIWKASLVFLMIGVVTALYKVLFPFAVNTYTDCILFIENQKWVVPFFLVLFVVIILLMTSGILIAFLEQRYVGEKTVVPQTSFVQKILKLPMRFFENRSAVSLLQRLAMTADTVESTVQITASAVTCIITGIVLIAAIYVINPMLGIICTVAVIVNLFIRRQESAIRANMILSSSRDRSILDMASIYGIKMADSLRTSGTEAAFLKTWLDYRAKVNTNEVNTKTACALPAVLPDVFSFFFSMLLVLSSAFLAYNEALSLGSCLACILMYNFLDSCMSFLSTAKAETAIIKDHIDLVRDVMEYPEERLFSDDDSAEASVPPNGRVELRNVSYSYGKKSAPIVSEFSLSVIPGQVIGLVGRSGCGKTTLLKLISGLYRPTDGEIQYDDRLIGNFTKDAFRAGLGFVPESASLFEGSIEENIRMGDNTISRSDIIKAAAQADIIDEDFIMLNDAGAAIAEGGANLSAGEKQKIEIARALARKPSVLLLDEALNSLHPNVAKSIIGAIRDRGITCILTTQRASLLRICDRITVMEQGSKMDEGSHEELTSRCELYRELCSED